MTIAIPVWLLWVVGGIAAVLAVAGITVVIMLAVFGKGMLDAVGRGLNW